MGIRWMLENRVEEEQQKNQLSRVNWWLDENWFHQKWVSTIIRIMMIIVRDNHPLNNERIFIGAEIDHHGCNYSEKIYVHLLLAIFQLCCLQHRVVLGIYLVDMNVSIFDVSSVDDAIVFSLILQFFVFSVCVRRVGIMCCESISKDKQLLLWYASTRYELGILETWSCEHSRTSNINDGQFIMHNDRGDCQAKNIENRFFDKNRDRSKHSHDNVEPLWKPLCSCRSFRLMLLLLETATEFVFVFGILLISEWLPLECADCANCVKAALISNFCETFG